MAKEATLQAELEAARLREKRLLEMIEGLDEAVYRMALPDGRTEFFGESVKNVTGYPVENFLNDPYFTPKIVHPDSMPYFMEKLGEIQAGYVAPTYEFKILDPEGKERWMLESNRPIYDQDGKLVAMEGLVRNITRYRQTEMELQQHRAKLEDLVKERTAELRRSEERFRDILLSMADWVWEVDAQGCYIYCSENVTDILGYTVEEVLGKTPFDFMTPESAAQIAPGFGQLVANKSPIVDLENWNIRKDGRKICLLTSGVPILDEAGNLRGYRGVDKNITERKQAEAEQERLQQEIISAQKRAIQELSTPIIPVMERIIVMPLIGSIDSMRARDITRTLLTGIRENRAKVVILDITGVPLVDSGVASHLNKTIQAARLKGAQTIITGVADAVAETIVELGIDWSGVETLADLQTGLVAALGRLGIKLSRE